MSAFTGRCPNCGGPVVFQWSSAVQTICTFCRSVVVRHDVNLATLGLVADLPPDSSPIQLGTEGRIDQHTFTVIGRLVYAYEDGGWNEWHLGFPGGGSAWLSDAQAEYAVTRLAKAQNGLPSAEGVTVGTELVVEGRPLQVTTLTRARYVGFEGELPFQYQAQGDVLFADLRGSDEVFATIDYSETTPLLFFGRFVEYDDLSLRNVRQFEGW
jgi:hypothetical protein